MNKIILKYFLIAIVFIMSFACTDDFTEMNTNPNSPTVVPSDMFFAGMLNNGVARLGEYQIGTELFSMNYAQYHAISVSYFPSGRYSMVNKWHVRGFWNLYYHRVLRAEEQIVKYAENNPKEAAKAELAKAWSAWIATQISDVYGDIPYTEANNPEISKPKYDTQKDIYYDVFEVLKTASQSLHAVDGQNKFGNEDFIYDGDFEKWRKLINSMRLRLAMRISDVDPAKAKQEGEAAIAAGVFDSNADNASVFSDRNFRETWNHLGRMSKWAEIKMSKTFENHLRNTSDVVDPRLKFYFRPAVASGEYAGQENGLTGEQINQGANALALTSSPGLLDEDSRVTVLTYAEVCFLKAEAALKGWTGAGDAKENYEKGIEASMNYLNSLDNAEAHYPDEPITQAEIEAYIAGAPFNAGGTSEEQLEQIITQKYLAIYPDGREAWAEFRRTGYPELIPFTAREADGVDVPQGEFIKRIWLPLEELSMNGGNADESKLNGNGGRSINVRLWWDVD